MVFKLGWYATPSEEGKFVWMDNMEVNYLTMMS